MSPRFCHMASCMISIHAPSRERLNIYKHQTSVTLFQSTLPHGSDCFFLVAFCKFQRYFNPRSLTGATSYMYDLLQIKPISIHAPSRERRQLL